MVKELEAPNPVGRIAAVPVVGNGLDDGILAGGGETGRVRRLARLFQPYLLNFFSELVRELLDGGRL